MTPQQAAMKRQALAAASELNMALGIPDWTASEKVTVPGMRVFANGSYQTVFANGSKSALANLKDQWAAIMRESAEVAAAGLHRDVWARHNRKDAWK